MKPLSVSMFILNVIAFQNRKKIYKIPVVYVGDVFTIVFKTKGKVINFAVGRNEEKTCQKKEI